MSQNDFVIDNGTGLAVRQDIESAFQALASNNSGSSTPSTTYAYQFWADTSAATLKIRNSANNAWIELLQLDGTLTLEDGSASAPALAFRDDLDTGIYSSAADKLNIATGGVERIEVGSTELVVNEDGVNCDFRVEGDTATNLLFCDAGNDRVGILTNSPAVALEVSGVIKSNSTVNSGVSTAIRTENDGTGTTQASIGFASSNSQKASIRAHVLGNGAMMFHNNDDTEKMRLDASGNLGIGVTSVSERLHVAAAGNCNITSECTASGSGANAAVQVKSGDGGDFLIQTGNAVSGGLRVFDGGASAERLIIKSNGRIQMPVVYSTAGSSMRDVQIEADGTLAGLSSITAAKTNITDLTDVSWIYNLKPKSFNFRKKTVHEVTGVNTYLDEAEDEKAHGFLAEDVEAINKDFCFYDKDSEGNDVLAGVYYKTMVVPLVKAVQDLKAENTALATRVAALEAG